VLRGRELEESGWHALRSKCVQPMEFVFHVLSKLRHEPQVIAIQVTSEGLRKGTDGSWVVEVGDRQHNGHADNMIEFPIAFFELRIKGTA
jgi:hypothetical protein